MKTKNEPNVNREQAAALGEEELGKVSGAGQFDLEDQTEGLPGYDVKFQPGGWSNEPPAPVEPGKYEIRYRIIDDENHNDTGK